MKLNVLFEHCGHCYDDNPNHFKWPADVKFELKGENEDRVLDLSELENWLDEKHRETKRLFETDEDYVRPRWSANKIIITAKV